MGLGYFALARAGLLLIREPEGIAALWPAAGYLLAVLLLADRRDWAPMLGAAAVAGLAANLIEGTSLAVSLGFTAANCGESLLAALALERAVSRPFSLAPPRATVTFVVIGGVAAPMVGGLAGAAVAAAAFDVHYWMTWLVWWTSAGLGILALTPLLLALRGPAKGLTPRALAEALLMYALLVGATALVFSADPVAPSTLLDRPIVILPILLAAAVRFDSRVVGLMLATLAGMAALYTVGDTGPFANPASSESARIIELQNFLLITVGTTLVIAAIMAERRRVTAALQVSEERAIEVVEGAHEAFVSIDGKGIIRSWNAAAESTFGWRREEVLGRELAETIIPMRLRAGHREGLARFEATGGGRSSDRLLELSALHRDGHELPVELTISPQRIGERQVFNAFIRDVSDRVAVEQKLRLQGEIMRNMAEGVAMVRARDSRIVYINRKFSQMFGYAEDELVGQPAAVINAPTYRDPAELADEVRLALARDGVWSGEVHNRRKDGTPFWCWVNISNFEHPEHGPVSVAVHTDITERKAMSEELERSNSELEEFAYVASHDLSEPLRVIGGFTDLLQRRYEGQFDDQADRFLEATREGVDRMQAMIDALLAYSRVGRAAVAPARVDCDRAVQDARRGLDRLISERGAELSVSELPDITGDPTLISQLFQNLISNAVKYGDSEHPLVGVRAERSNGEWVFSVEDNGGGIEPDQAERVFEMFQRLHGRDQAGTGIGLAICKRIVEQHGGRIWVEPGDGGGSAFRFTVPAAAASA